MASGRRTHLGKPEDWHLKIDQPPEDWFGLVCDCAAHGLLLMALIFDPTTLPMPSTRD